ncbi:MAG: A/G-specific adenine glycosylase [Phycisphaerales bacterium]|nr:A/G-specific adenine glycosylase [Phycisphaerales bacterium]
MSEAEDRLICESLESWFASAARELPWRISPRDPYWSLVSEFMLQQTQVSRVLEKFEPFIERFPSIEALASADEEDVLGEWSGLGYYRRARMLHACAKAIVDRHDGEVPRDVESLMDLPGIGRYTAGAIASMVFGDREPLVDGNVTRVLQRLHNNPNQQTDPETIKWSWERASALVEASGDPAVLNESLMELGATVCTPKRIKCSVCPIAEHCQALSAGTTESVPPPKPRAKRKELFCTAVLVTDPEGRVLMEQRGSDGLWGNMWQVPTMETEKAPMDVLEIGEGAALVESFVHQTTHRIVRFDVYRCQSWEQREGQVYLDEDQIGALGVSNAQRRILSLSDTLFT